VYVLATVKKFGLTLVVKVITYKSTPLCSYVVVAYLTFLVFVTTLFVVRSTFRV
jgi:hypothetical protein